MNKRDGLPEAVGTEAGFLRPTPGFQNQQSAAQRGNSQITHGQECQLLRLISGVVTEVIAIRSSERELLPHVGHGTTIE